MIKFTAKTRRIGDSIVVTLPEDIVQEHKIGKNELFEIVKLKKIKTNYFGAFKCIGHFTHKDRMKGQLEIRKKLY